MIRAIAESAALFLLPFILFALYLLVRRRDPVVFDAWTHGTVATLSVAGLVLAIVGVLLFGLFEERPMGAYVPAHVEGGRLVPGQFR
jgi:purine-cytosine permease-like protein